MRVFYVFFCEGKIDREKYRERWKEREMEREREKESKFVWDHSNYVTFIFSSSFL